MKPYTARSNQPGRRKNRADMLNALQRVSQVPLRKSNPVKPAGQRSFQPVPAGEVKPKRRGYRGRTQRADY